MLHVFITAGILETLGELSKILDHRHSLTEVAMERSSMKITLCLLTHNRVPLSTNILTGLHGDLRKIRHFQQTKFAQVYDK